MDYQPIVDEIRSFVQSVDQTLTDRIKEVAILYSQACNEVNQRLRRCDEFLQKGLRSEAVHLAQTEPILLDQLAILDFAERPQWDELAMMYGLAPPPQLRLETAAALNEAYADEQPLEELLRKHRLLAINRDSLKGRLSLMRRIAELDPANTVWPDDIRQFEKVRFQQFQNELTGLTHTQDYKGLAAIATELQTTAWLSSPPAALVNRVESTKNRFRKSWSSGMLRTLEGELNDAINAFDVERARQIREKWNFIAKDAELPDDDATMQKAALAFEWLKEQELRQANEHAFLDSLDVLEMALDKRRPREVVDQAYYSVMQYERELPPTLESRYRAYIAEEESKRRRKRNLIGAAIVTGSILLLAITFTWAYQSYQAKKLNDAVASLEKMLDDEQVPEARAFLDNLTEKDNATATRPEMLSLKSKLLGMEKKEQDRARRFQQALQEAEAEPPEDIKSPAVQKAESLARRPREWDALERLTEKRRELIHQTKMQSKEAFEQRVNELTKNLGKLEDLSPSSRSTLAAKNLLSKLQSEIAQLRPEAHKYGQSVYEKTQSLGARLDSVRFSMERNEQQLDLEYKLAATLVQSEDFDNYMAAVENYRKEFPNTKRSADFGQALKEKPNWTAVIRWSEIVSTMPNGPFDLEKEERDKLVRAGRDFQKTNPKFVDADVVGECLKCLDAVTQRDEHTQGTAAQDIQNLFEDFLVKDLWMIKTKDNKRYYSRKRVDFSENVDSLSFQRLRDFEGKEEGKALIGKNVEGVYPAPQSVLANNIRKLLPVGSRETTWISTMKNIAEMIIEDSESDPILRMVLVRKTIGYAAKGSRPLEMVFSEQQSFFDKFGINLEVAWMNPDDQAANETRPNALELLKKIPSLKLVPKKAAIEQEKLRKRILDSRKVLVGWLARGESGWECRSQTSFTDKELPLFVIVPNGSEKAVWMKIGSLAGGKFTPIPDSLSALVEGRLVFGERIANP